MMDEIDLKRLLESSAAETRRHFEITAESIKHEVRLVADAVAQLDQKVDREIGRLEGQIDRGFADTQAMIKFSHAELDRRVRGIEEHQQTLEDSVADLQTRIERLETSSH